MLLNVLWYFAFLNIVENANAKFNNTKINANPVAKFTSLKYDEKIIEDVYIDKDYDTNVTPNGKSLTWVSYEIQRFYVEDIDELKRKLILQIIMKATWIDSRVITNFSKTNRKIILLPTINAKNPSPLWMPFENLIIPHSRTRKNINDPIKVMNLKLKSYDSWHLGRFPPNTVLISATIKWRIIMECWPLFKYSDFPHDTNYCKFILRSNHINATIADRNKIGKKIKVHHSLSGFKLSKSFIPTTVRNTSEHEFEYSRCGINITFERRLEKYVYEYYLPCILIVLASILSFIIPLSALPARVGLVVTLFLTLINIFIHQRVNMQLNKIMNICLA